MTMGSKHTAQGIEACCFRSEATCCFLPGLYRLLAALFPSLALMLDAHMQCKHRQGCTSSPGTAECKIPALSGNVLCRKAAPPLTEGKAQGEAGREHPLISIIP